MVKELYVEEPKKPLDWDTETTYLYELTMEGVPLPADYEELLAERHNIQSSGDKDPSALRAAAEWDSYAVWLEQRPELEVLTPGERLKRYFDERT